MGGRAAAKEQGAAPMAEASGGGSAPDGHNPEVVPSAWQAITCQMGPTGISPRQASSGFRQSVSYHLIDYWKTMAVQQPLYQSILNENIVDL